MIKKHVQWNQCIIDTLASAKSVQVISVLIFQAILYENVTFET